MASLPSLIAFVPTYESIASGRRHPDDSAMLQASALAGMGGSLLLAMSVLIMASAVWWVVRSSAALRLVLATSRCCFQPDVGRPIRNVGWRIPFALSIFSLYRLWIRLAFLRPVFQQY